jgi:putative endopeptidase
MKTITFIMSTLLTCAALTAHAQQNINLDLTVKPGTDFFQYAGGGWLKQHPITAEYSRYGTFEQLREDTRSKLNGLVQEIAAGTHPATSLEGKIALAYRLMTDSVKLNQDGLAPLLPALQFAITADTRPYLAGMLAWVQRTGIGAFFGCGVEADARNAKDNLVQLYQGGISLRQRDYYLAEDSATKAIREAYVRHVARMFVLTGSTEQAAEKQAADLMTIETQLAKAFKSPVELRDPEANYHKVSLRELKGSYSGFDWETYFKALGLAELPQDVCIGQPEALRETLRIMQETSDEALTTYFRWKVINAAAPYLDDATYALHFDFWSKTLAGKTQQSPRWKRAIELINGSLGEAVGQKFVAKYFPPAAKERMLQLVGNLQVALGQRIDVQDWMSDTTKQQAHEKLATFYVKIGYPDKWRDYTALNTDGVQSLWDFVQRANFFESGYDLEQAGKPVDKDRWYMTPQTVNAYYNPTTNEICFPAAILQPPFFDLTADDAANYGAIGVVIGHEMSHGFDDSGRQFDKDGNLRDWWTAADAARFKERAKMMVDFFDGVEVLPSLHGNGALTLGENIADHGGLKIAYKAYLNAAAAQKISLTKKDAAGFTPAQRFFHAYGLLWAEHLRDEQIRIYTKSDGHSIGRWRVNGELPHIKEWYEAFGITPADPMYVAPEKRINLW